MLKLSNCYDYQLIGKLASLVLACSVLALGEDLGSAEYLSGRIDRYSFRVDSPAHLTEPLNTHFSYTLISSSSGLSRLEGTAGRYGRAVWIMNFRENTSTTFFLATERSQTGTIDRASFIKVTDLPRTTIHGIECTGAIWQDPQPRKTPIGEIFQTVEEWRIAASELHYPLLTIRRNYVSGTLHGVSVELVTQLKVEKDVSSELFAGP